ncbi:MAG: TIM barrel protein [Bryobacterales bacterium]|nr:TIM barrel protein [Bryobacterales bacterium]
MTRRSFIPLGAALPAAASTLQAPIARKGRVKQSVSRWCFNKFPLDDLCKEARRLGLVGIDLLGPAEWPVVQKYGLIPTMGSAGGKAGPLNRRENHEQIERVYRDGIEKAAAAKVPNLIIMSGNRAGMPDEEGLENCAAGLMRIKPVAEDKGVTVCLELLNSKVDHKDYMCDRTPWAVEVVKRVNSPRIKLLYDIYHMQIMEGDVIRTIRQNIQWIGHFHTGGNPGRHEIDDTQELNYKAIAQAVADLGFTGYFAHEFVPSRPDPMASLAQAVEICDV